MNRTPEAEHGPCPTPAALAAFLCGELQPEAMDEIGAHVSSCHRCDAAVVRMDEVTDAGLEALWAQLRTGAGAGPPTDSEYRRMVAAARAHAPSRTGPRAAPPGAVPARLGQYRIGQRLGQGGMGAVYRAEHVRLKKAVAVKILFPAQTRDPRAVARFQLEMEVVGRLDHPNVVRATDAGEAEGVHFLVMELIDGPNLAHLLYRHGPLPVAAACELVRQAAVGLQSAHEHGLVHRDVKPSNLMLATNGQVKLLDLGLALLRGGTGDPVGDDLTGIGEVMGTAEYMAPEQWNETHLVDIRADVYSLGCTLYALLVGDPPFTGSGRRPFLQMMAAHQHEPVRPVAEHRPDVPPALGAFLARMLAKSADDRPATPGEVAAELAHFTGGANLSALVTTPPAGTKTIANSPRPGGATPPPTPAPVSPEAGLTRPVPSRRRWLAAALVLAGAATAAGVYLGASAPGGSSSGAAAPEDDPPDPKRARNLLAERHDEQRLKRLWNPTIDSVLDHKRDKDALVIQSARAALIRLGDAPTPAYKLQIGLRQVRWQGGVGVYFGGREGANPSEFVFQYLSIHHTRAGPGREYGLSRARGKFSTGPGAKPGPATVEFATEFIPAPDNEEKLLEFEVKPNGLAVVRWNGAECPELVDAEAVAAAGKLFPSGGFAGEFGILCNGAAVTVSTARYVPTE